MAKKPITKDAVQDTAKAAADAAQQAAKAGARKAVKVDAQAILAQARTVVPAPQPKSRYTITFAGQPFTFRRRAGAVGFVAGLLTTGGEVEKAERADA